MSSSCNKVFKRDESSIRSIPRYLPQVLTIELGIEVFSFFWIVFAFISRNLSEVNVAAYVLIICICHSVFCEYYYNWYDGVKYCIDDGIITYSYELNGASISSNNDVTLIITSVSCITKVTRKTCVVKGDITKNMPLRRNIKLKKVKLRIDLTEREQILNALENIKNRSK